MSNGESASVDGATKGSLSAVASTGSRPPPRILIVDDEPVIREILSDFLLMEGYQVATAAHGREALQVLEQQKISMVVTDLQMPKMGGLELLGNIRELHPDVVTLLMTGYGTVETAIEAMKLGAFDYVLKPFKVEEVMHTVRRALEQQRLRAENFELRAALSLYQLAARLGDEVELVPILNLVVETIKEQTGADRVSVLLFPHDDIDWSDAHIGDPPQLLVDDLTSEATAERGAIVAHEAQAFRYLVESERTQGVRSILLAKLGSNSESLGVVVATRSGQQTFQEGDRKLLTIIADRAGVAVHNAQLFETLERTFRTTIEAFVTALEEKDRYTAGHSQRVAEFAQVTARELGWNEEEIDRAYQGGRLHDIGKLTLRTEDLNKPTALTDEEYERFKLHPGYGETLIAPIPCFRDLLSAIGGHHERWDGKGYPRGLAGEDIPLLARVMAVADTYDAMTSHRAYRNALKHVKAVAEIRRCAGTQFDPGIVEGFIAAIEKWRDQRREEGRDYPR